MKKIKLIKKVKVYSISLKIFKFFGFSAQYLIYLGYLLNMSRWINKNRDQLKYDDFINNKVVHNERMKLYEYLLHEKDLNNAPITYLEFGVGKGSSLTWWTGNQTVKESRFWAFDTFEGLPERFGHYEVGSFSQEGGFPKIGDNRITFVKGLFQESLLPKIPNIDFSKRTIFHLDADLYSATIFILTMLYPYMKVGDLIIFDEFCVPGHEFKAFEDFTNSFYIKLKPVGAINNYLQMVFEIEGFIK